MSKKTDVLIEQILKDFSTNKGLGSLYCNNLNIADKIVGEVVKRFFNKWQYVRMLIVTNDYNDIKNTRAYIKEYLNDREIKILSKSYLNQKYTRSYDFVISVGINDFDTIHYLAFRKCKFMMSILTQHIFDNNEINQIRAILPNINTQGLVDEFERDYVYSPVEERRIDVHFSDDNQRDYDRYTEFINNAVAIFGDTKILEYARKGDIANNISAEVYRYNLAKANGWNETLNMTVDFQRRIDEIYNPNNIKETAHNFYSFTYNRRVMLQDADEKLQVIADIVKDNIDKQILIVSKSGSMATKVAQYLHKEHNILCGQYHDNMDSTYIIDDSGDYIRYKSGKQKGEPKPFGAKALSTMYEQQYNSKVINVLSIKNASDPDLKIGADLVIFTSALCDDITEFKKRFTKVKLTIPTNTYIIYMYNTMEEKHLSKLTELPIVRNIIEREKNVTIDENNGSVIIDI